MFPSLCKVDRGCAAAWQVGLRGGYPGRRLVCSRASSIYWFKVSFLRGVSPRSTDLGDWYSHLFPVLAQNTFQYYFLLQSLHKVFPSTTLYYKACTNNFPVLMSITEACTNSSPVLLCTTKLAQTTSQYYFVLQSLHKALPSTTVYYKACTKHFPVLLCTTKLAQSTSQYYCVLQSLHKTFPVLLCSTKLAQTRSSTTVYCKACTKHSQQSRSQYCFALQSVHKELPSTTVYYKAWTDYFPVLLCTTKLAQNTSQYYFALQSLHKLLSSTTLCFKLAQNTSQYYPVLQSLHKLLPSTTLYYKACTNYFPVLMSITEASSTGLVSRGPPG